MQLDLDRAELERLLELAYLAERVLNDHRPAGEGSSEHAAVLEKIHALAEEEGLGYLVAREDDGTAKASPALEARMDLAGFLQDYDDCVLWDELAVRLAERDLREELGSRAFDALPPSERADRVDALAEAYDREFDKRGLDRLRLPSDPPKTKRRTRDALTERLRKLFDDK